MNSPLAVLGMLLLSGCVTDAALETRKTALAEANGRYDAALLAADAAALDAIYAEDFQYFGSGGVVRDKRTQIAAMTSEQVDLLEGRSSDVDIRIYGNTAVLTGKFVGRTRVAGREFGFSERYSTVWVNERARWRLVLEHGTIVEDGK